MIREIADETKNIQGLDHRLTLSLLPERRRNGAGDDCQYELYYRWYNAGGGVQGSEVQWWNDADMRLILFGLDEGDSIFDHFELF